MDPETKILSKFMQMSTPAKITNEQGVQEQAKDPLISQVVRLCKEKG